MRNYEFSHLVVRREEKLIFIRAEKVTKGEVFSANIKIEFFSSCCEQYFSYEEKIHYRGEKMSIFSLLAQKNEEMLLSTRENILWCTGEQNESLW